MWIQCVHHTCGQPLTICTYGLYLVEVYLHASGSLYLVVTQLKPRLLPIGKDLPQDDSKAPDITFRGEFPVHDTLWGHPANR